MEVCGDAENRLASELMQHELQIEKDVLDPLSQLAEVRKLMLVLLNRTTAKHKLNIKNTFIVLYLFKIAVTFQHFIIFGLNHRGRDLFSLFLVTNFTVFLLMLSNFK